MCVAVPAAAAIATSESPYPVRTSSRARTGDHAAQMLGRQVQRIPGGSEPDHEDDRECDLAGQSGPELHGKQRSGQERENPMIECVPCRWPPETISTIQAKISVMNPKLRASVLPHLSRSGASA